MEYLTPHFIAAELRYDEAPAEAQANLRRLADTLESFRAAAGVPLRVTSGYRSPAQNKAAGGVPTSEHLTGSAADFVPMGIGIPEFLNRVGAARNGGRLAPWGQVIVYPYTTGHVHLSLPSARHNNEVLVKGLEGGYSALALGSPLAIGLILFLVGVFILALTNAPKG